jgi:hypothetical protein
MDIKTWEGEKSAAGGGRRYADIELEGSEASISSSSTIEMREEEIELPRSECSCAVGISLIIVS